MVGRCTFVDADTNMDVWMLMKGEDERCIS